MRSAILLLAALYSSIGNLTAQNYQGEQNEIDSILENVKNFSKYVVEADYDNLGLAYTNDAKIFPNNREIIEGRKAIKDYWHLPEGSKITYHKITPVEIKITGDEAYDYGYYSGKTLNANGGESAWKGKYVIIWRKEEGDWKIYLDIWNRVRD